MGMGMGMRIRMKVRMRMCGHCEKARVIQPDGQVRQVELPVSVGDLLRLHPHHYVRDATNRRVKSRASIMPMEAQLESGGIYLLLPLPRLFPSSSFCAPSLPPPCACFLRDKQDQEPRFLRDKQDQEPRFLRDKQDQDREQEQERRVKCGPSIWMGERHQCGLLFFASCIAQSCKVSPEGVGLGLAGSIHGGVMKRSKIWEPSLDIILENDIQERKRIEHRVPKPSSSSCKPKPSSSSSSRFQTEKRDANANVIIL